MNLFDLWHHDAWAHINSNDLWYNHEQTKWIHMIYDIIMPKQSELIWSMAQSCKNHMNSYGLWHSHAKTYMNSNDLSHNHEKTI